MVVADDEMGEDVGSWFIILTLFNDTLSTAEVNNVEQDGKVISVEYIRTGNKATITYLQVLPWHSWISLLG
jgi:hypothetical protein